MVESVIQIKSEILKKCQCECKNIYVKKNYIWNPAICSCENDQYLSSIIDNSVITCDEITEETKTVATNFNEKSNLYNTKFLYFSCIFVNYYSTIDSS